MAKKDVNETKETLVDTIAKRIKQDIVVQEL